MEKIIKFFLLILSFSTSLNYGMSKHIEHRKYDTRRDELGWQIIKKARCNYPIRIWFKKPNLNLQDKDGRTALIYAAMKKYNHGNVLILLKAGADPNLRDGYGKTALMYAIIGISDSENISSLLKYGALIAIRDNEGVSAIDLVKEEICGSFKKEAQEAERFREKKECDEDYQFRTARVFNEDRIELNRILELLEITLKERLEKRNKKIREILDEGVVPTKVLQDLIQKYAAENKEVKNSEENYGIDKSEMDHKKGIEKIKSNCVVS